MNIATATNLAAQLRSREGGLRLRAHVVTQRVKVARRVKGRLKLVEIESGSLVFSGGRWGSHDLYLPCTSKGRALAHWAGYVAAQRAP